MRELLTTNGKTVLVDDEDYELVAAYSWSARFARGNWYAERSVYECGQRTGTMSVHRLIMDAPPGTMVDHRDGNGLNNTRSNLRFCTHSQNSANRHRPRKGFRGVRCKRGRYWLAKIVANRRCIYLGSFPDAETAARAYDAAARKYFGEFAELNFPEQGAA